MQQAEQRVQQVSYDGPELLRGGALDQLVGVVAAAAASPGWDPAPGAQRHTQPLHGVVCQVELQLQLDAVLVGQEDPLVLLHRLVGLAQEVLRVVGAVERRQVDVLQQRLQPVARQVVPAQGRARREALACAVFIPGGDV